MNKKKLKSDANSFKETNINNKYRNLSFTVVLVQPELAANIGSIARVMANFDFKNLIIFNPKEDKQKILSYETQGYAMHGKDILLNSKIIIVNNQENHYSELENFLKSYDLIIGTTAKGERNSNLRRLAIFTEDLTLPVSKKPLKIAVLFGKESRGLTNEELSFSDILIRIPTGNVYPTLNISHATAIILYEIFKKIHKVNLGRGIHPVLLADKDDRKILYEFINNIINILKIRSFRERNVFQAFKNVYERSLMTKRELSSILGLFSKVNSILKDLSLYES